MKIIKEKFKGKVHTVYEIELARNHILKIMPSEMEENVDSGGTTPHSHVFAVYRPHGRTRDWKGDPQLLRRESFFISAKRMKEIQAAINEAVKEIEKGGEIESQ